MPSAFSLRQSVSTRPSTGVRRSIRSAWATSSHSSTNQGWTPDSAARPAGSSPAVSRPWIASKRSHSGLGDRSLGPRLVVELPRPHRLAPRLRERPADAHDLADRFHLRGEAGLSARELLEREPRQLDDDVVERRLEGRRRRPRDVVRDLVQRVADGELGGDLRDRVAGGLGRQRGRARDARVHLDDDQLAVLAVQGELDVRAAGLDADRADHGRRGVAQHLVLAVAQRLRGCDGGRVAGVDAHRVDVLDRADDDHVVDAVADHLELELAPAGDRLLEQDLRDRALAQSALDRMLELLRRGGEAAAVAAERERGPDDDGQVQRAGGERGARLLHPGRDHARRHAQADGGHRRGEELAVLRPPDGVVRRTDQLDAELVEDAVLVKLRGEVERRLPAERRQERVGPLAAKHGLHAGEVERLEVRAVGPAGVGHDRRRVRVDEDRADALGAEHAQRLAPGVVELARLADDDRAGADDGDRPDIGAPRQRRPDRGRRAGRRRRSGPRGRRAGRGWPRDGTGARRRRGRAGRALRPCRRRARCG